MVEAPAHRSGRGTDALADGGAGKALEIAQQQHLAELMRQAVEDLADELLALGHRSMADRTRLLAAGSEHVFRPVDPDAAEAHLSRLLELYFEGLTRPLAFFEHSSFQVGAGLLKGTPPTALLAPARKAYDGEDDRYSHGADLDDPAVALCMRGRDPVAEGVDGELMKLAEEVWTPALEHLEEVGP